MLSLTLRRPINYKITASPKKQNISVGEQFVRISVKISGRFYSTKLQHIKNKLTKMLEFYSSANYTCIP